MKSFKNISRALVLVGALASAQSAFAQVSTAENGVSWNLAPSLTFSGSGMNSIDLNSYSGKINGSNIMTFGSGDSAGQISFTGGSYSSVLPSGTRMVGALLGEATINFATQQQFFGMNWGSVDTSNVLSFYNGTQLVYSTTGANAVAGAQSVSANGSYSAGFSFAEVGFTKVVLMETTAGRGFEVNSMTYSAEAMDVAPIPLNAASLGGLMSFLMMLAMRGKGGTQVMVRMAFASIMPRRRGMA